MLTYNKRKYVTFNYPDATAGGKTLLTGIRKVRGDPCQVYITGFYDYPAPSTNVASFVYKGNLCGKGTWNLLNYPDGKGRTVLVTNLYGPNNSKKRGDIVVVGNYTTVESGMTAIGCMYQGPLDGSGTWTTLIPPSQEPVINTIAHSNMGNIVVGNYDTQLDQGKAFIYDITTKKYTEIIKPNAKSITAYGVWHNCGDWYTICGGYSDLDHESGLDSGYLVDWNNKTKTFSNWTSYSYPGLSVITHFDGITSDCDGGYNLTGDWVGLQALSNQLGFFANVKRKYDCYCSCNSDFSDAKWESVSYPNNLITSGNSVYGSTVIGVYTNGEATVNGYLSFDCCDCCKR